MAAAAAAGGGGGGDGDGDMEVEAFRRLYPARFYQRYLDAAVRPDARLLNRARPASISLGPIPTADGSALVKVGNTTMLAGVKLEVMAPSQECPDLGQIVVDFQMPPICSPNSRPGRPAEVACAITEQISNALTSSGVVDLHELLIAPGKAAWMAYLDIYCLDADGSLLDVALLASVAALAHLQIPSVVMTDEGKVIPALSETGSRNHTSSDKHRRQQIASEQRQLKLGAIPWSLTCALYKKYVITDPTAEEESVLLTTLTVIIDSSGRIVSIYKPGGSVSAATNTVQECILLAKRRTKELQHALDEALGEYGSNTG